MDTVVSVEMHAFAYGKIRKVRIPEEEAKKAASDDDLLELAFMYGQNNIQPLPIASVSVGDVVILPSGSRHRVQGVGFRKAGIMAYLPVQEDGRWGVGIVEEGQEGYWPCRGIETEPDAQGLSSVCDAMNAALGVEPEVRDRIVAGASKGLAAPKRRSLFD